ncbi:MAG: uroporphyrinogen-III C-methyltransferase [Polyangiaceae bacterium]
MANCVRPVVRGKVWLVGAGPGDPELLTVRAARVIGAARVVAYDELVPEGILALAPRNAERIPVGRRAGGCKHHDGRIHPAVIDRALAGVDVVRVKCGDPYVFGRGGEEAEELAAARVPFEVVPGVTAAVGAAAAANVPLTHRDCASSVTFATAHLAADEDGKAFVASLPSQGTLVLYMGLGSLDATLAALARARGADHPAAVVSRATWVDERTVMGTLRTLGDRVREAKLEAPAVVIVGEVVSHAVESPRESRVLELARAVGRPA